MSVAFYGDKTRRLKFEFKFKMSSNFKLKFAKKAKMKTKPFLSQLAALVVVAAIFYASYGATNALASARANVPEIYFAWERAVPFWAWSIVPYLSLIHI